MTSKAREGSEATKSVEWCRIKNKLVNYSDIKQDKVKNLLCVNDISV